MEGIQVGDQGPFHSGKLLISYFVARHSTIAVVSKLASSQMVITLARSNYLLYNTCIGFIMCGLASSLFSYSCHSNG